MLSAPETRCILAEIQRPTLDARFSSAVPVFVPDSRAEIRTEICEVSRVCRVPVCRDLMGVPD